MIYRGMRAPHFPSDYFLAGMPVAGLAMTFWFLFKGVNLSRVPAMEA